MASFDVGAVSFREAVRAITQPEQIISRIYEEHKQSGFGEAESAIIAMQNYKDISQVIYGHALAIVEAYEQNQ